MQLNQAVIILSQKAGQNANTKTIAVSWGYYPENIQLADCKPDLIVDTPQAIATYLFG